jgi:hypothetical protein
MGLIADWGETHRERPWLVITGPKAGNLQLRAQSLFPSITRWVKFVKGLRGEEQNLTEQGMVQTWMARGASAIMPSSVVSGWDFQFNPMSLLFVEPARSFDQLTEEEQVWDSFLTLLVLRKLSSNLKSRLRAASLGDHDRLVQEWFFHEFGASRVERNADYYVWDYQALGHWLGVTQIISQSA